MASVAVGDVLQYVVGYRAGGQQLLMVRHYRCIKPPASSELTAALGAFLNAVQPAGTHDLITPMKNMLSTSTKIEWHQAQKVSVGRYRALREDINVDGVNGEDPLPSNVACTITLGTEEAGRGLSGSVHIGGIAKEHTSENVYNNAFLAVVTVLGQRLTQGVIGTLLDPTYVPVTYRPAGNPNWHKITLSIVRNDCRVMRRRTLGVGI